MAVRLSRSTGIWPAAVRKPARALFLNSPDLAR